MNRQMKKVITFILNWFKEPEVYAPNCIVETTRSNVFNALTQEESVMALREYGRLCKEVRWLNNIETEMMHNHLSLVNNHITSKRIAEKYLVELCNKYHFDYALFMNIIDKELMLVLKK